jgi:ubiquinone/menaquinone biosynthesis C-methylase UbiE
MLPMILHATGPTPSCKRCTPRSEAHKSKEESMTIAREKAMTTQEQEQIQDAWDNIAAGYDEFVTPTHRWLANEALQRVGLRPGIRFLDVAAGSGALSIPAARLGAKVLAVNISPAMIERLEAHAREEGLSNLEARVMDGHALEFDDDAFDISGSQFWRHALPGPAACIQ